MKGASCEWCAVEGRVGIDSEMNPVFPATSRRGTHYTYVPVRITGIVVCLAWPLLLNCQLVPASPDADTVVPSESPISNDRILGVIPNFQTVSDPTRPYVPLRVRDKWTLFLKETADPYTFASVAAGAGISQWHNNDPRYGDGFKPYMQRYGAAVADIASQNFFGDALLASLFHEDPRYFRRGPGSSVMNRIEYALSRTVITRRDSGRNGVNFSGVLGTGLGIALSNAYYPPRSVSMSEVESRFLTSFASTAVGNLLPEFWPDVRSRLARYKRAPGHILPRLQRGP